MSSKLCINIQLNIDVVKSTNISHNLKIWDIIRLLVEDSLINGNRINYFQ